MNTQTTDPLAGFDLGPVLNWLTTNRDRVAEKLNWLARADGMMGIEITGQKHLQLSPEEIVETIDMFPHESHLRSELKRINGMPPTWFARGTTVENILVTDDTSEALTPTAIIPGYTAVDKWTDVHKVLTINLYTIPGVDPLIAKYMLVHALIHEYTHTLLMPMLYNGNEPYILEAPGKVQYQNAALLQLFGLEAAKHPPISHYAAAYRPFPDDLADVQFIRRASEEFCESVAAYMMGYIYCDDPERCWNPLVDRPLVKLFIENFLHGKRMT